MRRFTVLLAVGLLALGACMSATEPTHSVTGLWKGVVGPNALTLSLVMHPDRSVSGEGIDSVLDHATEFPIRGTVSGSTVVLLFTPASVDSGFSGSFTDASRIQGSLDLPGFSSTVELRRQ
jgi:hypothetical protein